MQQSPDLSANEHAGLESLRYPRLDFSLVPGSPDRQGMDSELGFDDVSDSSYEIVSQDSFHNSDDESHDDCTDSVASLPENNHEDMPVVLDLENSSADTTTPCLESASLESTVIEESLSTPSLSSTGFGLSPFPSEPYLELPPDWVNFKESSSRLGSKYMEVSHTIQDGGRRQGQFLPTITVNQTMSKKLLKLDKPLHIVYCGNITIKHDIIEKLAGAVAASLRVPFGRESPYSKLQIVPISNFGDDYPNAQVTTLPSTGLEINVGDWTYYLVRGSPSERPDQVYYEHCSANEVKSNERNDIQSRTTSMTCRKPDLAIVTHSSADFHSTTWQQSRALARYGVPVIDINEIGYALGSLNSTRNMQPSTSQAVHMRFQVPTTSEMISIGMPIDVSTFLSIAPHQLNRNLACLTSLSDERLSQPKYLAAQLISTLWSYIMGFTTSINGYAQWWNSCFDRPNPLGSGSIDSWNLEALKPVYCIPLVVAICSMLMLAQFSAMPGQTMHKSNLNVTNQSSVQALQTPTTLGLITISPTAMSAGKPQKLVLTGTQIPTTHTEYLVSTVTKIVQLPAVAKLLPSSTLDFWLYKTDQGRLFLHSSKKLPKKWQPPKDWIEVSQGSNRTIPMFSKFNESTYEIHVDLDGSCDPLTVIVQPSKGQHAQKIFQLHDRNPCKRKRTWTQAASKLAAWQRQIPAELHIASVAVVSRGRDAVESAKSTILTETWRVGDMAQQGLKQCSFAFKATSGWLRRSIRKTPAPVPFSNSTEALLPSSKKSLKIFERSSSTFRNLTTQASRSVNKFSKATMQGYRDGVSCYLRMQRDARASIEYNARSSFDTLRKDMHCATRIMSNDLPATGMKYLNHAGHELQRTKNFLGAQISAKYAHMNWWKNNTVKGMSRKLPHISASEPLRTARKRLLTMGKKMQRVNFGMRQKNRGTFWSNKVQTQKRVELDLHNVTKVNVTQVNVTKVQEQKATWRRVLRL